MIHLSHLVNKKQNKSEIIRIIYIDPNKEPQQVFNIIPQQNLYEPWGRPGAGAPLIHQETGQKFTRYAGSLEDKLVSFSINSIFKYINISTSQNIVGPLGFYRRQYSGNINDQKHDAEIQHQRRQQERTERRLNVKYIFYQISNYSFVVYRLVILPTGFHKLKVVIIH